MQKFTIQNHKGKKIVGLLQIPENPIGLAFVLHGLGGYKEQPHIEMLANVLFEHGYTTVNFDATNSIGESDGTYEEATMGLHYEDLCDVISWAKTQGWYKEPFVLVGHSLGGYAVARYAEDYPNEVQAVFPYALVVAGDLSHEKYQKFKPEEYKIWKETGWRVDMSKSRPGLQKRLPWSHMEERLKHDLRPSAGNLTMPVLFVVGEKDSSCPPEHQKVLFDLVPGPKEMHIVPGAPHTFRDEKDLTVLKDILSAWLLKI